MENKEIFSFIETLMVSHRFEKTEFVKPDKNQDEEHENKQEQPTQSVIKNNLHDNQSVSVSKDANSDDKMIRDLMHIAGIGIGLFGMFMLTTSIGALGGWSLAEMLIKAIFQTTSTDTAIFCGFLYGLLSLSISAAVFFYTPVIFNSLENKIDINTTEDTAGGTRYEFSSSSEKKPNSAHNSLFSVPPNAKNLPIYQTRVLGRHF